MSGEDKAIEDRFKGVYGHSPGAFKKGTSLKEKIDIIGKKIQALKTSQSLDNEQKMKKVADLNKELKAAQEQLAKEERANLKRIEEQLKKDNISIKKEPKALKPQEPEQKRTAETSIQTDKIKKGTSSEQAASPAANQTPVAEKIYPILDKGEEFNQDQAKSEQFGKQHGLKTEEKQPDAPLHEHQKQPQQQENTQEFQEKASIWSRFTNFVKKVLEKLTGKEDRVEHIKNEQEIPQPADNNKAQGKKDRVEHISKKQEADQKNTAVGHEAQGKETSLIEINGEKIDLEPGKNFSYVTNDKTLSINITYTNQLQPEVTQQNNLSQPKVTQQNNLSQPKVAQQNNLSQPKVAQQNNLSPASMNLNINGEGHSIPYGGNFSYTNNNLKISVTHGPQRDGHQQERIYDKILNKEPGISKGLREHGVQIQKGENNVGHIAPMSTISAPVAQGKEDTGPRR